MANQSSHVARCARQPVTKGRPIGILALSGAFTFWAGAAGAQQTPTEPDVKHSCATSFEQAQRLRNDSHYLEANQEVLKCTKPACGDAIFQECTKIYNELQSAIPSIVFAARDKDGNELSEVAVTLDGQPIAERIDGTPIQVDPGSHTFRFYAEGYTPVERFALIRVGERFRPVMSVLGRDGSQQAASRPGSVASEQKSGPRSEAIGSASTSRSRSIPFASYVLGGAGILATAGFVAFRVAGARRYDDLQRECTPHCSQDAVDGVKQKYLVSDIAVGVGAAAFAAALTVYFVAPREPAPSVALQIGPIQGGIAARWDTRF